MILIDEQNCPLPDSNVREHNLEILLFPALKGGKISMLHTVFEIKFALFVAGENKF